MAALVIIVIEVWDIKILFQKDSITTVCVPMSWKPHCPVLSWCANEADPVFWKQHKSHQWTAKRDGLIRGRIQRGDNCIWLKFCNFLQQNAADIIKAVVDFVRRLPACDDLDEICKEVFS